MLKKSKLLKVSKAAFVRRNKPVVARRTILLRKAKSLIKSGFSILPLELSTADVQGSGKRPITMNGVKDATRDYTTFAAMVGDRLDFNIGIATGALNNLLVIDVDPRNGGRETMQRHLENYGKFAKAPLVYTGGGGYHRYFMPSDLPKFNGTTLGDGVDIKYDNGYVVAPPSSHASGKPYRWKKGQSFRDITVPVLPPLWRTAILEKLKPASKQTPKGDQFNDLTSSIAEGNRNTALTSLAGTFRACGLSDDKLEAKLLEANQQRCKPPLHDSDVRQIARSAKNWVAPDNSDEMGAGEILVNDLLSRDFKSGAHLRFERDGQFYEFSDTHWKPIKNSKLQRRLMDIIRENHPIWRKRLLATANEAMSLLRIEVGHRDDALHFVTTPSPVINTVSGEIWLLENGSHELRLHAATTGCRHVLAVTYDPKAKCLTYDKALREILSKHKNPKRVAKVFHQLVGYIIQPDRRRAVIPVFVGGGGNGKSKLAQTIGKLLGEDTVYSGDITRLESSPFGVGGLVNKLLFIDDDVKAGVKLPDGVLKKVSEGKELTGERKHKDPFNFINRAVPMLLFNNVPSISDVSEGIRRRLMVFRFDRKFTEAEQDVTLFDRIWANELSGILNHALEGWGQFVANKHKFDLSQDLRAGLKDLLIQGNPLPAFIEECCVPDPKSSIPVAELFNAYSAWAESNGYKFNVVRNKMTSILESLGYTVKRINGYPCVNGLALCDTGEGNGLARTKVPAPCTNTTRR